MNRSLLAYAGGTCVLVLILYAAFKPAGNSEVGRGNRPTLVTLATTEARDVPLEQSAQGTVTPVRSVAVRPRTTAWVTRVAVDEGQRVSAGQLLFVLDPRADAARLAQGEAQLDQSRSQLADAERELARNRALRAQGFVSQAAVDSAQARVDVLKAAVGASQAAREAARVSLADQTITAPFAGRIGAIDAHLGSLVQPGMAQPMTTLVQLDPIDVRFTLPQSVVPALMAAKQAGRVPVTVTPEGVGPLVGELVFIDNAVDPATGTLAVKARFKNADGRLWPGAFVPVRMALGVAKQAVVLPVSAVQSGPEDQFVFMARPDGTVARQVVTLRRIVTLGGRQFAVVEGVAAGVKVVAEGGQNLRPGGTIKVVAPAAGKSSAPGSPT
jgi:RND family efflux transporter MFP subunit